MTTGAPIGPRSVARWALAAAYLAAGILHLTAPDAFVTITPAWVPRPETVVALTGMFEIAGAVGLCVPRLRKAAGIALAVYAVCVFPGNIQHALNSLDGSGPGWWYHAPRLALQPVIIWWALWASGITDWPFGSRPDRT
jgi:uncharacterized membrane protein